MTKYKVRYEFPARPSDVIIEVVYATKEEAEKAFEDKKGNVNCRNVKLVEIKK